MNDKSVNYSSDASNTFKFDRPMAPTIVLTTIKLVILILMVAQLVAKNYLGASVCFFGFLLFLFVGLVNVIVTSDIVINDTGISRGAFGKVWLTIAWSNVSYIKIFDELDGGGKYFNIYPSTKPRPRLLLNGKMAFNDKMERSVDFIKLMNVYILSYNIKIESIVGGIKTYPSKLQTKTERGG